MVVRRGAPVLVIRSSKEIRGWICPTTNRVPGSTSNRIFEWASYTAAKAVGGNRETITRGVRSPAGRALDGRHHIPLGSTPSESPCGLAQGDLVGFAMCYSPQGGIRRARASKISRGYCRSRKGGGLWKLAGIALDKPPMSLNPNHRLKATSDRLWKSG